MGLGASTEASDLDAQLDDVINREYGFRVHRVEVGSPGELAGLQSILDYIVVANGVRLDADDGVRPHRCGFNPPEAAVFACLARTARRMQRGPSACSHEHLTARSPDWLRVPAMCDRYICSDDFRVCQPGDCVHRVQHAHNAHERDRAGASV